MSVYTIEVDELINIGFDFGLEEYELVYEKYIDPTTGREKNLRLELNEKIINHFRFREIGAETPERFKFYLNRKMDEIMPYYNQRIKSCMIEFNPLYNIDITESYKHTINNTNKSSSKNNSTSTSNNTNSSNSSGTNETENLNVESNTPQSIISEEEIKLNKYASNTAYDKQKETSNTSTSLTGNTSNTGENKGTIEGEGKTVEEYTKNTLGSSAGLPFSKAIAQWRKIMINIFEEIFKELEPLFMQLW